MLIQYILPVCPALGRVPRGIAVNSVDRLTVALELSLVCHGWMLEFQRQRNFPTHVVQHSHFIDQEAMVLLLPQLCSPSSQQAEDRSYCKS